MIWLLIGIIGVVICGCIIALIKPKQDDFSASISNLHLTSERVAEQTTEQSKEQIAITNFEKALEQSSGYLRTAAQGLPPKMKECIKCGGGKPIDTNTNRWNTLLVTLSMKEETLAIPERLGWSNLREGNCFSGFVSICDEISAAIAVIDGTVYITPWPKSDNTYSKDEIGTIFCSYTAEGKLVADTSAAHPIEPLVLPFDDVLYYEVIEWGNECVSVKLSFVEYGTTYSITLLRLAQEEDKPAFREYQEAFGTTVITRRRSFDTFRELFAGKSIEEVEAQKQAEEEAAKQRAMQATDALFKLKTLLDQGIITQEEFDRQKGEFLSDLQ